MLGPVLTWVLVGSGIVVVAAILINVIWGGERERSEVMQVVFGLGSAVAGVLAFAAFMNWGFKPLLGLIGIR